MLVVETKIRRAHFVQGKALKAISRKLKISRKGRQPFRMNPVGASPGNLRLAAPDAFRSRS